MLTAPFDDDVENIFNLYNKIFMILWNSINIKKNYIRFSFIHDRKLEITLSVDINGET